MSYNKFGNLLDYFRPVMAEAHNDTRPLCAIDIGASSGTHGEFICTKPCVVSKLLFSLSLEAASGTVTAPTVVFAKRITPGSDTGKTAMGTLTVPSGSAIGKTIYKDITPVKFAVGDLILLTWTVGSGTPTGIGDAEVLASEDPEQPGNNSDMIASA